MELHTLDVTDVLAGLEAGEFTSAELVRALHARTDAVDGPLNALVHQMREEALAEAERCDAARARGESLGPLHGVPFTIKENIATAGKAQTMGIKHRSRDVADSDAPVVQAIRAAGGIILGKGNVPLLLLSMECHNDIWGTSYNPWNTGRVPGGSSGGEAAAIASGQAPAGVGTDIGGSIRIPCAWCGIPGIKPTVGRWSMVGSAGAQPGQEVVKAQMGPMARSVRDLTLIMRALSPEGQHALDPTVPPVPFDDPDRFEPSALKIGYYAADDVFPPAASVQRAVNTAVEALRALGCELIPYAPPNSWALVETYFGGISADGATTIKRLMGGQDYTVQLANLARMAQLPGPARRGLIKALRAVGETRIHKQLGRFGKKPVDEVWALSASRTALRQAELAAWRELGIDILLAPPTVTPAAIPDETGDWSLGAWHTMRYNILDLPAGVVPVSRVRPEETRRPAPKDRLDKKAALFETGSEGLPVAVQVVGRPWEEDRVLAVMAWIEAAVRGAPDFPKTPTEPLAPPA